MKNDLAFVLFSSLLLGCTGTGIDSETPDGGSAVDAASLGEDLKPGPAAHIQANVAFVVRSVSPSEAFKANTRYDFDVEVEVYSSQDEQFRLVPRIDAGWTAAVTGSDTIDASPASAIAGLKVTKVVTVTTGASGSAELVLNLDGTKFAGFTQSSQPTRIALGAMPAIPSSEIRFIHVAPVGDQAAFRDNTLFIKRQRASSTSGYQLSVLTVFQDAGTYQISEPVADPSSDWQPKRQGAASFTTNAAGLTGLVSVRLEPRNSGGQNLATDGRFSLTVSSADGRLSVPFSARLRVVDVLPEKP